MVGLPCLVENLAPYLRWTFFRDPYGRIIPQTYESPSSSFIYSFFSKLDDNENTGVVTIAPTAVVADPFNTDFASDVLPDKGDPFDTTHVKGGVGKAEIKALEEELDIFDDESEFDPRLEEGTKAPTKIVAAGIHILTTYYIHSIFSSQCLLLT